MEALKRTPPYISAVIAGTIAGLFAVASVDQVGPLATLPIVKQLVTLPLPTYPVVALGLVALLVGIRSWAFGLVLFFSWLPLEDLVRKLAGNDIRVYFIKYVLLLIAIAALFPHLRGLWRRTLGNAWAPTLAVIGFAVVMALPAAATNPRIPVVGLTVRFIFILLVPVGAFLASDAVRLRRALQALGAMCGATCALGMAQAIIGPTFLNPAAPVKALTNIVVVRTLGEAFVIRPSGPFADTGRFASMTVVTVVVGVCLVRLAATPWSRRYGLLITALGAAGAFSSGGRAPFVIAMTLTGLGLIVGRIRTSSVSFIRVATAAVVVVVAASTTGTVKDLSGERLSYYVQSLNPTSEHYESGHRLKTWWGGARLGIKAGGAFGIGTGTQSVGRQYISGATTEGKSESGWGNVATEGGLIGLALWIFWVYAWLRRSIRAARKGRDSPAGPALPMLAMYHAALLIFFFTITGASFDDYIANSFFWLSSGIAFGSLALMEPARDLLGSPHGKEPSLALGRADGEFSALEGAHHFSGRA